MSAAQGPAGDFRLSLHGSLSDSYEMSNVLLARASFDGTLQLLTSGWERTLGYGREELNKKTLLQLMWSRRNAAAVVAAILNRLSMAPADLRVRCRNGLGKSFKLHRRYDEHQHMMYVVAEETEDTPAPRPGGKERRSGPRRR